MKNAIILHGAGTTSKSFWYPYIKRELERRGYSVWDPQLPNADHPTIAAQLPFVLKHEKFSKNTVIIAHSAGVPLTLSVLERCEVKIRQAILVAGFVTPLQNAAVEGILQPRYSWKRIRRYVDDLIFIHSDNDPWGCGDRQGRRMFDKLGGTLVIVHGEGHFGSTRFHQSYREFPLIAKLLR